MTPALTKGIDEYVSDLKNFTVTVHFLGGYTHETMRPIREEAYTGDILNVSMKLWPDLRGFTAKLLQYDRNLQSGIHLSINGLDQNDPRFNAVKQHIFDNLTLFMERWNDPRWG